MPISIFHIGLPLDHPAIPPEERPKIAARLIHLKAEMRAAGYEYEVLHAAPETGLDAFAEILRTRNCNGVFIGGGVVSDEALRYFLEQIVDVTHAAAPRAKIMFHSHDVDPLETVQRWFPFASQEESTAEILAMNLPIGFIPTKDPTSARVFYEHTLGLAFESEDAFALVFRIGPGRTMLRIPNTPDFTPAPFTIFGWQVDDIEATVTQLSAKGVPFQRYGFLNQDELGIWSAPGGTRIAWFQDPDGNTLSLSQHS